MRGRGGCPSTGPGLRPGHPRVSDGRRRLGSETSGRSESRLERSGRRWESKVRAHGSSVRRDSEGGDSGSIGWFEPLPRDGPGTNRDSGPSSVPRSYFSVLRREFTVVRHTDGPGLASSPWDAPPGRQTCDGESACGRLSLVVTRSTTWEPSPLVRVLSRGVQ